MRSAAQRCLLKWALRTHLRMFFAEIFVRSDADVYVEDPYLIYVVNHIASWDAEVLLAATLRDNRQFSVLADNHVVARHAQLRRLGFFTLDDWVVPTRTVSQFRDSLDTAVNHSIWLMPQRSHWPVSVTTELEHGPALFGREFGERRLRYASLCYEFLGGRRPFVFLMVDREPPPVIEPRLPARKRWLEQFRLSHDRLTIARQRVDVPMTGLLYGSKYGLVEGIPTLRLAVQNRLRDTTATVLVQGGHLMLKANGTSESRLRALLNPMGKDRAAALLRTRF